MAMTSGDVDTSRKGQHAERLRHVEMALESLYNVIHTNAGVEAQCIGHFKLLFSLLRIQGASKLQMLALQVHTCLYTYTHWNWPSLVDTNAYSEVSLSQGLLMYCKAGYFHGGKFCGCSMLFYCVIFFTDLIFAVRHRPRT